MMSAPMHKVFFVNAAEEDISGKDRFEAVGSILGIRLYFKAGIRQVIVDPLQKQGYLPEQPVA